MKSFVLNAAFLGGMGAFVSGLWWWAPWVSMVVGGALLMILAALGHVGGTR